MVESYFAGAEREGAIHFATQRAAKQVANHGPHHRHSVVTTSYESGALLALDREDYSTNLFEFLMRRLLRMTKENNTSPLLFDCCMFFLSQGKFTV